MCPPITAIPFLPEQLAEKIKALFPLAPSKKHMPLQQEKWHRFKKFEHRV
jgi:hypothetical protein